ncbi:MAG: TRAP transporter large permease subunit, partial [Sphaerochaetaceae bacterium]
TLFRSERPAFKVFLKHLWQNIPALFMPVLILGSIMAGIMSTTESALAGVVYVLIIQIFVYKELKFKDIPLLLCETARLTGSTVLVIATTSVVSHILTYAGIPAALANWVLSITESKLLIFIFMNIILLLMGTVMDMMPCLLIFQPIFYPIALQLGLSPVQFGVMMTINLAIGLFTPPVGQTLYISSLIGKVSIEESAKACIPFFLGVIGVLFLVIVFPPLTTFLPSLVMGV